MKTKNIQRACCLPRAQIPTLTFATLVMVLTLLGSAARAQIPSVAYTADPNGTVGSAANNSPGLDIGHTFTVSGSGIVVYSLGVFDYQGNGLDASHVVALFNGTTPVTGGSVTVPQGTVAPLQDGFRFWPLAAPVTLPAGSYTVVVYQLNGQNNNNDPYGQGTTGFIADARVKDTGTVYDFESAIYPTAVTQNSGAENLASCSFTYAPVLASTDYVPITLASGSYNADAVVEAGAPAVPFATSDCTMDNGTVNTGNTWYEVGANSSLPSSGVPLHGSTFTSSLLTSPSHSYAMAPDYHMNDVAFVNGNITNAVFTVVNPAAYSKLSFLTSAGHGPNTTTYTVRHADGTAETGTFITQDWFNGGSTTAFEAVGRVSVPSSYSTNSGGQPFIYGDDITLTDTTSPVTNISFGYVSGGNCVIFAVSGANGGGFTPITVTGYNEDMIVEASAEVSLNKNYTTESMDTTGNTGNSWYELGYDKQAALTGIPNAGTMFSSATLTNHYFTLAPSYTANDVAYVNSSPSFSPTLTLARPGFFSALSFLTAAGNGPVTINYSVNHADGTSEYGSITSPDWFANTSPNAWTANGRVTVDTSTFNNVNGNDPDIYSEDITLSNPNSQVVSVNLSTSSSGRAVVFALSGLTNAVAATGPNNIVVAPAALTGYLGGAASFSVTAGGTLPFSYQWYQGGSMMPGQTSATLLLTGLSTANSTTYTCAVGNSAATNLSGPAVLTVLPLPPGDPGVVLADEPLAYYRLNEPAPTAPDMAVNSGSRGSTDNATNFPGAAHQLPGAIVGDPDTAMGYSAIDTNSDDGAVPTIVPYDSALNPNGSFTVELWLRPTEEGNLGNAQAPLNNDYTDGSGHEFGWDFYQRAAATETPDANGPGYSFRMWNGGNSGTESQNLVVNITGGLYTVGAWAHLVAVYDAVGKTATLYFNGAEVAQATSGSFNGTYAPNPMAPLGIGGYADGTENPFIGQIDEVAIYGTALSATQVLTHYQNGTNAARAVSYPSVITGDGALEYLRLDEPAVNVAHNSGSLGSLANGVDSNTGNPVAGPSAPAFSGFESDNLALLFNGSDYVELLNPPGLNFTGPITLEAWILPGASQNYDSYILAHGDNDTFSAEVFLRIENGAYQVGSIYGKASYTIPTGDLGGGQWIHLAGSWGNGQWTLYRNGVQVATGSDSTGPTLVNNANWAIGARGRWKNGANYPINGLQRQFNGVIDEVAIYGSALPASHILAHYAESMPPIAGSFSLGAVEGAATAVSVNKILSVSSTSHPGGVLSIASVTSPTTNGATVTMGNGLLTYTSAANLNPDTVNYVLTDGFATAPGTISVVVSPNGTGNNGLTATVSGGNIIVQAFGIPGQLYYIQQSTNAPGTPPWEDVGSTTANALGRISCTVSGPVPSPSFYRTSTSP